MKFLFFSTQDQVIWGGSEVLWCDAAKSLLEAGHEVSVCYRDWGNQQPKALSELITLGAQYIHRPRCYPEKLLGKMLIRIPTDPFRLSIRETLKTCVGTNPDCIVVTTGSSSIWPECRTVFSEAGIPYCLIVQAANDRSWYHDGIRDQFAETYRGAKRVFYVSEGNRQLINRQLTLPRDFGEVVFNPFTVSHRPGLPWPESNTAQFAFVGRLEPEPKGIDLAVEVFGGDLWKARDYQFRLFGQGPCANGIRKLISLRGAANISLMGFQPDVTKIWKDHHALVIPSRFEGMPLALIEAMLCERVCIATDVAGNAELLEDGVTGFVAESPSVRHLSEAMERAWTNRNRWEIIGKNAGAFARARIPQDPGKTFAERLLKLISQS
jgi:glycosyltransferase involved in cell wall biosynthesis